MILHPWNSAEEIDRRLSALNDPELAELLKTLNRDFTNDPESYVSESAPYWKKRIAFIALAGLLATSAGYSYFAATSHQPARAKHQAAVVVPPRHHPKPAVRHAAQKHHAAPVAVVRHRTAVAPPVYTPVVTAPDEAQIRQARAQLLHERALAAQARADAARAHHQAQIAMQAKAQAQAQARAEALAQAKAEAVAQARAEALARAQAQAQAQAQQQADAQWEEQRLQMAKDAQVKQGPPPPSGGMSTYPRPSAPAPVPGPVLDPNCTPHRGSLFVRAMDNVRLGDTSVGAVLRLIHP
jgi:hypothetical protein